MVLREANLGKKPNCPLKDITTSRRFHGDDKLQRKNKYTNQVSFLQSEVFQIPPPPWIERNIITFSFC